MPLKEVKTWTRGTYLVNRCVMYAYCTPTFVTGKNQLESLLSLKRSKIIVECFLFGVDSR